MFKTIYRLFESLGKIEKAIFFFFAGIFCVTLVITIWTTFVTNTTLKPARGGEYSEGLVGQPTALNPMLIGSSETDKDIVTALFSDILTLAHSVATSTNGKVWLVTLKEDMVWSDGKAITADDVLFTVHTIQNSDAGSPLYSSWQGVTVERVSQIEVRFTLKSPYAYFIDNLRSLRIAPAHIFESIPPSNIRLSEYNLEPITSGPYSFVSYEKQRNGFITDYHLVANNDYPGTRALIENLNFKFFENYNEASIAFNKKIIDGLGKLDPSLLSSLKISHNIYEIPVPHYYALFLNGSSNPVLKDKSVRQALALATDKKAIIDDIFEGHADIANGPLSKVLPGYAESVYINSHTSAEEASALLEKQQWKIGADGIRARTLGKITQKLDFEIAVPNLKFLTETAEMIKVQWQKIGVRLTIKALSADEIQNTAIRPRTYQILLFGNVLRANSDLFSFWHSSQRFQPGQNFAVYENKAVDKLIETTRSTFDVQVRNDALTKIQQAIETDVPAIFLFSPTYIYAAPTNLGGFSQTILATPEDKFNSVNQWFLKTSRVFK